MKNITTKTLRAPMIAAFLLALSTPAPASIFSGWKPFRKPLEPAKNASAEVSKLISGSKPNLPPAAQQQVDKISEKAEQANTAYQTAEETLSVQRDNFVLAAIGLCLTNVITLGSFWHGSGRRKIEKEKAELEIELLKTKLANAKAGKSSSADESI